MPTAINNALMRLSKRAESQDRLKLVETFVDIGPLFTLLSRVDHQVVYGRRGTGKTHALWYLAEKRRAEGDCVVYVDLRTVGSTGGLYSDSSLPITERATRLLADTLATFHEGLLEHFIQNAERLNLAEAGAALDRLAQASTEVAVVGTLEVEQTSERDAKIDRHSNLGLKVGSEGIQLSDNAEKTTSLGEKEVRKTLESGKARHRVHFGAVGNALERLLKMLAGRRAWLLLDEWSSVPAELQPYLADLIRRSLFPVSNCTVKIAAIEQRSKFKIPAEHGDYLGIELGADAAADLNFDDFMVFEHDASRAMKFFQELLYKHVLALEGMRVSAQDSHEFVREAFTQRPVFEEFVRSAEGVPRDAINIVTLAAQRALDDSISMNHLRVAARDWYQRDKEAAVKSNPRAHALLHWVIQEVIGNRHARAFLLRSDQSHDLIDSLFDSRLLHVLKRNIAAHDQPGIRYDVFKLDYGCYVDLISTVKAPQGLLQIDNEKGQTSFVEVPPDDYRAIRTAILDIRKFEESLKPVST